LPHYGSVAHCGSVAPLWFCCPNVILLPHYGSVAPLWFCCPTVVLLPHCGSVAPLWFCCPTVVLLPHCGSVAPLWFCCPTVVLLRGAHTSGCPGTPTLWQLVQPPAIYSVDSPSVLPILRWEGGGGPHAAGHSARWGPEQQSLRHVLALYTSPQDRNPGPQQRDHGGTGTGGHRNWRFARKDHG
jgi:hypothetical protein